VAHSREEILEQVKTVLSDKLGIEETEITEEASFEEDLGADSFDLVEVVMDLEVLF
jgi:acyl carrier protein